MVANLPASGVLGWLGEAVCHGVDPADKTRHEAYPGERAAPLKGPTQLGVGTYQVTQTNRKRCSAADTFIQPVRHRPSLRIRTHAYVTRVCLEGRRAPASSFSPAAAPRMGRA